VVPVRGPEQARGPSRGSGQGRDAAAPSAEGLAGWLAGRLPDGWFVEAPAVQVDREEILVVGRLPAPELPGDADPATVAEAELGRITRFREQTREERMAIARETERRYGRVVSWGAEAGSSRRMFTTLSVPVMTRLRQPERQVLDTLVEGGVARSRADALAWCVKLVGRNADPWLGDLREALEAVQRVRGQGPGAA
jgi:hypothetical protein